MVSFFFIICSCFFEVWQAVMDLGHYKIVALSGSVCGPGVSCHRPNQHFLFGAEQSPQWLFYSWSHYLRNFCMYSWVFLSILFAWFTNLFQNVTLIKWWNSLHLHEVDLFVTYWEVASELGGRVSEGCQVLSLSPGWSHIGIISLWCCMLSLMALSTLFCIGYPNIGPRLGSQGWYESIKQALVSIY